MMGHTPKSSSKSKSTSKSKSSSKSKSKSKSRDASSSKEPSTLLKPADVPSEDDPDVDAPEVPSRRRAGDAAASDGSSGDEGAHAAGPKSETKTKTKARVKSSKSASGVEGVETVEVGGGGGGAGGAGGAGAGVEDDNEDDSDATFESLGVCAELCDAVKSMNWTKPSPIQRRTLPHALAGRDIIGLAETGSGKTGSFALPILEALLRKPQKLFALVLAPTRELAFGIAEQFNALGSSISLSTAVIVGGVDMMTQAIALARQPHVVVATPGRLVDHLEHTKGFSLRALKFLVLDEADRMLSLDFEEAIDKILQNIPRERTTYLYSATMTSKVSKLQRASLRNPARVEVSSSKYATVDSLVQQHIFIPAKYKDCYLAYILNECSGMHAIVFLTTCKDTQRSTLMLKNLGFSVVCLHGQMSQSKRLGALNKFKSGGRKVLLATDVASRGLDIPHVDLVINLDIPASAKDYVHRVGRTARAGRSGRAITFVTQYDLQPYLRVEKLIGKKLPRLEFEEATVLVMLERVAEAQRLAALEMRESGGGGKKTGKRARKAMARDGEEFADPTGEAAAVLEASVDKRRKIAASVRRNKKNMKGSRR